MLVAGAYNYYKHVTLTGLNNWMQELDKRYKKRISGKGSTTPPRKRVTGAPAKSSPPVGAPKWSIDPEWTDGMLFNYNFFG